MSGQLALLHHDGNAARSQVLLVLEVAIGCHEHLETRGHGCRQQVAVSERIPAMRTRLIDGMLVQRQVPADSDSQISSPLGAPHAQ